MNACIALPCPRRQLRDPAPRHVAADTAPATRRPAPATRLPATALRGWYWLARRPGLRRAYLD